jgi:hypothetical protein
LTDRKIDTESGDRMTNYEKDLKVLKSEIQDKRFFLETDTALPELSIRRLAAMDLIILRPFADGVLRIELTPTGEFYDDFKKEKRKEWFALGTKELIVAILGGGVVLLIGLIF